LGGLHILKSVLQRWFVRDVGGGQSALWGIGKWRITKCEKLFK